MSISSVADLYAAVAQAQKLLYAKNSSGSFSSSILTAWSGWLVDGTPGIATTPGAASTCTQSTRGAMPFAAAPAGKVLAVISLLLIMPVSAGATSGLVKCLLYDRLVHSGGLSGTLTTVQNVNTPALPRYTSAEGVECFLECYSALGATSVTATITYTNSAGTAGRTTTVSIPANMPSGWALPVSPADGDTGFKSVESVQLSASTLTAGNFGITLAKRLATSVDFYGTRVLRGVCALGFPQVDDDACLWPILTSNATGTFIRAPIIEIGLAPI